jgi:hypothetical protein
MTPLEPHVEELYRTFTDQRLLEARQAFAADRARASGRATVTARETEQFCADRIALIDQILDERRRERP